MAGARSSTTAHPSEVNVLDFAGDLYGQEVIVAFHGWIRPEMKFPAVSDLVARMAVDVAESRAILAAAAPGPR